MSSRSIATLGMFAALIAALGFLLSGIPNVELMTLGAFVAGAVLGVLPGSAAGATAMAIYSGFNPYGMAPPPTFAAQVIGAAGIGAAGGVFGARLGAAGTLRASVLGAGLGFGLSLGYDLLTNLGTAVSAGLAVVPTLVGGIAFGVWHIIWNAIVFAVAGPPLLAALRRRRARVL